MEFFDENYIQDDWAGKRGCFLQTLGFQTDKGIVYCFQELVNSGKISDRTSYRLLQRGQWILP
jgi:hypothetical protein